MAWWNQSSEWDFSPVSRDLFPYVPPKRRPFTLADFGYAPEPRPATAELPQLPNAYGDLGAQGKHDLRREAILRFAAALAAPGGRTGEALAGQAADLEQWKRERVQEARARGEHDYAYKAKQADDQAENARLDAKDAKEKQRIEGMMRAVEEVAKVEPDLAGQAEAAARSGDTALLHDTLKEANRRAAAKARGEDPNDPFADERTKARIKTDEDIRLDTYYKEHGKYQAPKESVAEIEARSAAAARGQRSVWGGRSDGEGGGRRLILDHGTWKEKNPKTGIWEKAPGVEGGYKSQVVNIYDPKTGHNVPHAYDPETGLATPIKTPDQLDTEANKAADARVKDPRGFLERWTPGGASAPAPTAQVLTQVEQSLGRKLTADERSEARKQYIGGAQPADIATRLRAPKPLTSPKSAPTAGKVPAPALPAKKSPPPRRPPASGAKSGREATIRQQAPGVWATLPEEQRRRWGSYAAFLASRLAAAGG